MRKLISILVLLCCHIAFGQTQESTGDQATQHITAQLLADHQSTAPGQPFVVGVLLQIEKGWHVYWKHPGDSGLPTSVKWTLPKGFTISPLLWPTPRRFTMPGGIDAIGYENSVLLMACVTPPEDFKGAAEIQADVRWLACSDTCVPGKATAKTTVEVNSTTRPANRKIFADFLRRVPSDSGGELGAGPFAVDVKRSGLEYELTLQGVAPTADVELFLAPPEGIAIQSQRRDGNRFIVQFRRLSNATTGRVEAVIRKQDVAVRVLLPID